MQIWQPSLVGLGEVLEVLEDFLIKYMMNRQIWSCFPFFFQTKPFLFCEMGIFAKSPDWGEI